AHQITPTIISVITIEISVPIMDASYGDLYGVAARAAGPVLPVEMAGSNATSRVLFACGDGRARPSPKVLCEVAAVARVQFMPPARCRSWSPPFNLFPQVNDSESALLPRFHVVAYDTPDAIVVHMSIVLHLSCRLPGACGACASALDRFGDGVAHHHQRVACRRHQVIELLDDLAVLAVIEPELLEPFGQMREHFQAAGLHA